MRRRMPDVLILAGLFFLPLLLFWQQTAGGRTMLPAENLYRYEPYATYRAQEGVPETPYNHLISDLVLQNMQWKAFIRQQLAAGEIPLWNPHQLAGVPFLAAGQPSTLYPLNILYYVLDLPAAYGWFTVVTLWMAGAFMFLFARGIGIGRTGAALAGVTYQLSGFMVINALFPMIIAGAAWLPLLLLLVEFVIRRQPLLGKPASAPWTALGAVALGCNVLAGHPEITYYTLLVLAVYAGLRLLWEFWQQRGAAAGTALRRLAGRAGWLVGLVALGLSIGAAQFLPLFELASANWRAERPPNHYELVTGQYAHPARDVLLFVLPNFYGNPTHHSYLDIFSGQPVDSFTNLAGEPIAFIDWGIKNYVEGAVYLGVLPLALVAVALLDMLARRSKRAPAEPPYRAIFALLALVALTFMFGLPTYRLVYLLPGINQLNTPFRWIVVLSLAVALLAGFGMDALERRRFDGLRRAVAVKWARRLGGLLLALSGLLFAGLLLSRVFYAQLEPLLERVVGSMALADRAFSGAAMFYSYQFTGVLTLALFLLGAGVVLVGVPGYWNAGIRLPRRVQVWRFVALALVAADLLVAAWGFYPASDPAWLDFTPPGIAWLREHDDGRFAVLDNGGALLNANMGWRYGLDDVRGYESVITGQYVAYMRALAPQPQLDFNRIAPFYEDYALVGSDFTYPQAINAPLLDLLGVRYLVTTHWFTLPAAAGERWREVYRDDAVTIYENSAALPLAYFVPDSAFDPDWLSDAAGAWNYAGMQRPAQYSPAEIAQDSGRERLVSVAVEQPGWLIVSESYFPGWRAYRVEPDGSETALTVELVQGNFQGVRLEQTGSYSVRLVYSPTSFQLGAFFSFIGVVLALFISGVWLWRLYVAPAREADSSTASRVARNSIAPILLNLFNRGIDFAFAAVMLRVLGPADAGLYQYAIVVFVWFDIFTNFGLNTFLTREIARDRTQARHYFLNTSVMRLALMLIGILPLAGFIAGRQALVQPALDGTAILALALLYLGLLPNSLSTGMSALFYAFEKAEYPSAVATVATINKAVFGLLVLALGYGIVGLAAVSILTNFVTFGVLMWGGRALLRAAGTGRWRIDPVLIRRMARDSAPLMLNHFLATIFFQIDVVLIEAIHGAAMVGQYSVAYKWLQAINVVPAFFTMALLPVMARQAHEDKAALQRTVQFGIKLLSTLTLPLALFFTVAAYPLTQLLGGAEFLPDGAIALQLMIWSIPIGWINSLTQYVLIALDLQRRITWAFVLAVGFNIIANLIFIPPYGYRAAALTTIASEAVLLLPFALLMAQGMGLFPWVRTLWRQLAAGAAMLALVLLLAPVNLLLGLAAGFAVYGGLLLALGWLTADEAARLAPLLPARLRRRVPRAG